MSDINGNDQDRHNWKRGDSFQWGERGIHAYGLAQTPYKCEKCGKSFVHFYHQEPNIYAAMKAAGIPDQCS